MTTDESVSRAMAATEADHAAAIATVRCVICGAQPGAECVYGVLSGPRATFPGRAHTRRVRAYLDGLDVVRVESAAEQRARLGMTPLTADQRRENLAENLGSWIVVDDPHDRGACKVCGGPLDDDGECCAASEFDAEPPTKVEHTPTLAEAAAEAHARLAEVVCPCGCGADREAHCWDTSEWVEDTGTTWTGGNDGGGPA